MGQKRQRYNEKFKREAVKYIQSCTKTISEIAEELNVPAGTLQKWMAKYRSFADEPVANRDELRAAKQRIKDLEEEVEILKKAVHFFSKDRN